MQVSLIDRQYGRRMYEVRIGAKWWTASHNVPANRWDVCNSRGTWLRDHGDLWWKIVSACEKYADEHLDQRV